MNGHHLGWPSRGSRFASRAIGSCMLAAGLLLVVGCETKAPLNSLDKAQAAFDAGQWGEAIATATEAISENSSDVRPYVLRGRAFRRLKQFQPAITDFTVAIQLMPKEPENYYLRAGVYRDEGDIEHADEDDKAGQKLDPSYQQAYLYAPPGMADDLPAVANELMRALRGTKSSEDESAEGTEELYKKTAIDDEKIVHGHGGGDDPSAFGRRHDGANPPAGATLEEADEPTGTPVAGQAPPLGPRRPDGAAPPKNNRPVAARPAAGAADETNPRAALRGRADRYVADPNFIGSRRPGQPFVAGQGPPDEGHGPRGGAGHGGAGFGGGGFGGGGFGGPIDPYGGYTHSAKPIGGGMGSYGAGPYGSGSLNPYSGGQGGQGDSFRGRGNSRDLDPTGGGAASGPSAGGAINPYAPYPPAQIPYNQPAGLRYD